MKGRKMLNHKRRHLVFIAAFIGIIILGFCASAYRFYSFNRVIALESEENSGKELHYSYDNDKLTLRLPDGASESDAVWYCLDSSGETKKIEQGAYEGCAAFLAVMPEGRIQRNGREYTLYEAAKAVTDSGSGHYADENVFSMKEVPFEAVMNAKELTRQEDMTLWLNGERLADTEVVLSTVKGERTVSTDKNGTVTFASLDELRSGITVTYSTDSAEYRFSLIAQHSEYTKAGFLDAVKPVLYTLLISVIIIAAVIIIRRRLSDSDEGYCFDAVLTLNRRKDGFWRIRETVQILFFILIFYGAYIFGFKISNIDIPVYACGWNTNQFVQCGSCYYISHASFWLSDYDNTIEMFRGFREQMSWSIKELILWGAGWVLSMLLIFVLFGRLLCGFLCPFGFVQDKLSDLRQALHIKEIKCSEKGYKLLRVIQAEMFIIFVGIGFFGIDYCHFCPAAVTTSPAFAGFRINVYVSVLTAAAAVAGSFFKDRFFCNICPMGFVIGLFHRICPVKIRKSGTDCTECGGCYDACPVGIKSVYTEHEKEDLTCNQCLMCGKCINQCPRGGALRITVFGKTVYRSSAERFLKRQSGKKRKEK